MLISLWSDYILQRTCRRVRQFCYGRVFAGPRIYLVRVSLLNSSLNDSVTPSHPPKIHAYNVWSGSKAHTSAD